MNDNNDLPSVGATTMLSRRTVLDAVGATPPAVSATAGTGRSPAGRVDAIVIGAGFAGVTAARALGEQGRQTLLLEARDRIGGRTWTSTFAGEQIELGGAWVHGSQPHVWREVARYNIKLVADAAPERAIFPTGNGFGSFDPGQAFTRQGELLTPLFDGSREYFERPHEPFFREDLLRKIDGLSLRDRLDQLRLSLHDENWINGLTAAYSGGSSERGSLTMLAHWWSLVGWSLAGWNGLNIYRPESGMTTGLLQAMLADASTELRLNSPVTEIVDDGRGVDVLTRNGDRFSASVVVVAVPVNVWKTIRFTSGLPREHRALAGAGVGALNSKKIWMLVGGDVGQFYAQAPEGYPFSFVLPHGRHGDGQLIVGFGGPSLDVTNPREIEQGLQRFVPEGRLIDVKVQNWGAAEFSLGGHSARQPWQLTRLIRAIQQPHGRLVFASSDIASVWSGYIDGAIESGLFAATHAGALATT